MESPIFQGLISCSWLKIKALMNNFNASVVELVLVFKKLGQDDPRRIIHSIKVGVCLSLVSLFYYYRPLYDNFGISAMWAVMTVVVVFEFSVGATIGKGLNRGLATLLAGALGVGAQHLASLSGRTTEPVLLGLFVFLQAVAITFLRFFPKIKARYDYGLLIFILTFSLISVSAFRVEKILEMAHRRLSTIIIGGTSCVIISILVCPVWAGEDLHNLIALNMEKLGTFLEGFANEYFRNEEECRRENLFFEGYKSVLNAKNSEESLANFARWEPGHGRFHFQHPWKQYLKIGTLVRQCAYRIEALNGYLNSDVLIMQGKPEIRSKIQEVCTNMSIESGKALKELAMAMKNMIEPFPAKCHVENSNSAAENLNFLLNSGLWEDVDDILEVIPVASLMVDVVKCTEEIVDSVQELAVMAGFATISPEKMNSETMKLPEKVDCPHVVIIVRDEKATPDFGQSSIALCNHSSRELEV